MLWTYGDRVDENDFSGDDDDWDNIVFEFDRCFDGGGGGGDVIGLGYSMVSVGNSVKDH